ncbi:MAG TPA: hypothetical protein PKA44_04670 [Saprospiraceae bacterium]|nr:hypothetical protein [Saprospiraceae bacterium]
MGSFFKNNRLVIIGALLGFLGGFFYWYFGGCADGHCAITSKPLNSSAYGGIMGALLFSMFTKK